MPRKLETIKDWDPKKLLDDSVEENIISPKQQAEIWCDNLLRWLNK